MEKMKVVILCGGEGTRLREETEYRPKPMVAIGGMPILWHIMKYYSSFGFSEFVLCLGYKGEMIKEFFQGLRDAGGESGWEITFADTGLKAMTGARIKRVEKHITTDNFLVTYGDGLSNLDLNAEIAFHRRMGRAATLAGVHPHSKFGRVKADSSGVVSEFLEKPVLDDYVNGGFYVFQKEIMGCLSPDDPCVLETAPFEQLVEKRQMAMYRNEGFWHSMDTYKDFLDLNAMWDSGNRPWKVW
ncbi:Bifunctional protein GlmU [uncultured archaeon]|nr:Bifunctional protein GlmU [uncultured archaeon]